LALLVFVPVGVRVLSWPGEEAGPAVEPGDVQAGKVLFTHEWRPNDPLCPKGDGLGPVYNATSCAACHRQGALGGGGGLEHNVTTFAVEPSQPGSRRREGVVHAYAVAPVYQETLALVSAELPAIAQPTLRQLIGVNGQRDRQCLSMPQRVRLAQRNTPALFGVGLMDAIPDRILLAQAKWQRLRYGLASADTETLPVGRAARLPDGRIGRFGWKAQSARLADFVRAACANELGLGNPGNPEARPMNQPNYQAISLDLTKKQCDQLTAFIAALPQPVERAQTDAHDGSAATRGKALFSKVGCAECHVPRLGSVSGIYSDLLLHRMGQELEGGGSSYGGQEPPLQSGPSEETRPDEWRTPPLWGVADSGPYLHDGRAATLLDAIRLHRGQGTRSAGRFERLSPREQDQLIAFLKSLRAPRGEPR
jgi:CxxC motif-containing protein (DUF1111 family)